MEHYNSDEDDEEQRRLEELFSPASFDHRNTGTIFPIETPRRALNKEKKFSETLRKSARLIAKKSERSKEEEILKAKRDAYELEKYERKVKNELKRKVKASNDALDRWFKERREKEDQEFQRILQQDAQEKKLKETEKDNAAFSSVSKEEKKLVTSESTMRG